MKKLIFIYLLLGVLYHTSYAQEADKVAFQVRMNNHVTSFLKKDIDMNKAKELYGHTCDVHHVVTEDEIKARAADAEKNAFIHANMAEYKKLFFPQPSQHIMMTDTSICDNGGFEDDFDFYYGFSTTFDAGSLTCSPSWNSSPSTYIPRTLPTTREFEIVSSGTDIVTGLQKVKFGNKSLKLNDLYNHNLSGFICNGDFGVNKLVKRFKVTEENRDFTVWFSIALENPSGHGNQQPFFNISCDLAPLSELCFDADILQCDSLYAQPSCGSNNLMDVLDWSCHRIKIPPTEIGQIATLEIVMSDCGQSAHNGYAYIDGICESCKGSTLGYVELGDPCYDHCDSTTTMICGQFTYPTLCGDWVLDSLVFPDFEIDSLVIDTNTGVFCFNIPITSFGAEECLEFFVQAYFSSDDIELPMVCSNSIEICKSYYNNSNLDSLMSYISNYDSLCNGCLDILGSVSLFSDVVDSGLGILYRSCDGDVATICGELKYPEICEGWVLDSLIICGIGSENLNITSLNGIFCFEVPFESFGEEDCLSYFAKAYFRLDTLLLPILMSDTITVCKEYYEDYEYEILTGDCHDNSTTQELSDDYYFVKVTLGNVLGESWYIDRQLTYPYPDEDGLYTVSEGVGDSIIFLGPFLRQEGPWTLYIYLPGCIIEELITPPTCPTNCVFGGYIINNIECTEGVSPNPTTWEFKLFVPGTSGSYVITSPDIPLGGTTGDFGVAKLLDGIILSPKCITLTLTPINMACTSKVVICPPKPCDSENNCDLEVYIPEVTCDENGDFSFNLSVDSAIPNTIICYETVDNSNPSSTTNYTQPSPVPPSGPFYGDIQLIVRVCEGPSCREDCDDRCFKVIYIPKPDCEHWENDKTEVRSIQEGSKSDPLLVYPNPNTTDEFTIVASKSISNYHIFTLSGEMIQYGVLRQGENKVTIRRPAGLYILSYTDVFANKKQIKLVKL